MADLYEFPYIEQRKKKLSAAHLQKEFEKELGLPLVFSKKLPVEKHTFTHHRVELFPALWKPERKKEVAGYAWVAWKEIDALPFSSGHRRILKGLK